MFTVFNLFDFQGLKSKYEYRYLFVDIKGYPPYIMKDNRHEDIEATYLNL